MSSTEPPPSRNTRDDGREDRAAQQLRAHGEAEQHRRERDHGKDEQHRGRQQADGGERGRRGGDVGNPARDNMRICSAPPVAAPPGSARLNAFPASCDVATSNHASVSSATRISSQMQTNARASSRPIGTNHAGNTPSSCGRLPNVAMRLGATMYSATPVTSEHQRAPDSFRPRGASGSWRRVRRVLGQRRFPGCVIRLIASARVAAFVLNRPRTAEVMVSEPGFLTPRIDMQKCSASIITSTPVG